MKYASSILRFSTFYTFIYVLKVTWEMPAEYQQQQKLPAQQTTTQPNSETKGATQKEIPQTPNETKEITATQKESTKESDIQNGATARVKRDAEAQEQIEPAAKKAKMEVDESYPTENFKPPLASSLLHPFPLPPSFCLHVVDFDHYLQRQAHKESQCLMSSPQFIIPKVLNKERRRGEK